MAHAPTLVDIVEGLVASGPCDSSSGAKLSSWVKAQIKNGEVDDLVRVFPRLLGPGLDYTTANFLCRALKKLRQQTRVPETPIKIAVLGSFTTHPLVLLTDLFLSGGRPFDAQLEPELRRMRQDHFFKNGPLGSSTKMT
jgi:hypothetical protein